MRPVFLLALLFFAVPAQAQPVQHVVELFTSQGCPSCPEAEVFLGDLQAERSEVLVLGMHVDYFDGNGWKDAFSSRLFTARQVLYGNVLQVPQVFTPQAVVNGQFSMVGYEQAEVRAALTKPSLQAAEIGLTVLNDKDMSLKVKLPFAVQNAAVLVVGYRDSGTVAVGGDNFFSVSPVVLFNKVGVLNGQEATYDLTYDASLDGLNLAALVQQGDFGPMIAAARLVR